MRSIFRPLLVSLIYFIAICALSAYPVKARDEKVDRNPSFFTAAPGPLSGFNLPWKAGTSISVTRGSSWHEQTENVRAYDFALADGDAIFAAKGGVVRKVVNQFSGGGCDWDEYKNKANYVEIDHGDGTSSFYAHLQQTSPAFITEGETIVQGELIGLAGHSGYVCSGSGGTGAHLHFLVRDNVAPGPWGNLQNTYHVLFTDASGGGSPVEPQQGYKYKSDNKDPVAILYEHAGYQGRALPITNSIPDLCHISIDFPNPAYLTTCFAQGSWNDVASSIRVMPGYEVTVYIHNQVDSDLYQNDSTTSFKCGRDYPDLSSELFPDGVLVNDNISRIIVSPCGSTAGSSTLENGLLSSSYNPCSITPQTGNDNSDFISDVTIPDQTLVTPGQVLTKTWRIRNNGQSTWGSGYQLAFIDGEQMGAPSAVSVPSTSPSQNADINVSITAPTTKGLHTGYWQMRNPQGTYFGDKVWVQIKVDTAGSHITVLTADPPPPADAETVRIHARVEGFPNFRAMRILIDGQVQYELGATEIYYNWITSGYSAGQHSIVVEVADQSDTSWSRAESRGMIYTLTGTAASNNHAPNRPSLVQNPAYDWYVQIGSAPQVCAQAEGDSDGDSISAYRFVASASVGTADSGWVSGPCHNFGSITPGTYEWHAQVRDEHGGESAWSDSWHFTVEPSGVTAFIDHFSPASPSNAEDIKIFACSSGHGGVNVTLRVMVNDAADGTDSGEWHIIKEQGSPCFNDVDAPVWHTLEYADGPHLVRVLAWAIQPDAGGMADVVYTLNHRRPAAPKLAAPVPASLNYREPFYMNSTMVHIKWEPALRAESYTLHIGFSPSPKDDPSPLFRTTVNAATTELDVDLAQPYAQLYWQVTVNNDAGSNASIDQLFGVDLENPTCAVQPLPDISYENVFQVNWSGSDSLSGVNLYDIQYQDERDGAWYTWLAAVPASKTYDLFSGLAGHHYGFRCRTTDSAGNTGDYPSSADAAIDIDPAGRPPTPWWDAAYAFKRNLTILNNMASIAMPAGYIVHLHFDSGTVPSAVDLYAASLSSEKCADLRIVRDDIVEVTRKIISCTSSGIDIWFRTQTEIGASTSNGSTHQLYYGSAAATPPAFDRNQLYYPVLDANHLRVFDMLEGSGSTLADATGNGSATISSELSWFQNGKFGPSVLIPGDQTPEPRPAIYAGYGPQPTCAFSVEAWIRRLLTHNYGGIIAEQQGGWSNPYRWTFRLDGGRLALDIGGRGHAKSNATLDDPRYFSNWHHVAATYNCSGEVRFYIDNVLDTINNIGGSGLESAYIDLQIGHSVYQQMRIAAYLNGFALSNTVRPSFPYGAYGLITTEPTLAVGDAITPPSSGSADLAVQDLAVYPNPDGGFMVMAIVKNIGDLATGNGFYTDLYVDHLPVGAGDYTGSLSFWVNDPIAAGESVTLTTVVSGPTLASLRASLGSIQESCGMLYAQVDSSGSIGELDEGNNITAEGTPICSSGMDSYETDDIPGSATLLMSGTSQLHNLHDLEDEDWLRFSARDGLTYLLRTFGLGSMADTILYIYDTDGQMLLASNDDYGSSLASQLTWTAPADGTYFIRLSGWNPSVSGYGTSYWIRLGGFDIFLPGVWKN